MAAVHTRLEDHRTPKRYQQTYNTQLRCLKGSIGLITVEGEKYHHFSMFCSRERRVDPWLDHNVLMVGSSMWPAYLGSAAEACFPTPFLPGVVGVVTADLYCVG